MPSTQVIRLPLKAELSDSSSLIVLIAFAWATFRIYITNLFCVGSPCFEYGVTNYHDHALFCYIAIVQHRGLKEEVRWVRTTLSAYTCRQPYESIFTSDLQHLTTTLSYSGKLATCLSHFVFLKGFGVYFSL